MCNGKEVKEVWKNHFEYLMYEETEREAIVLSMGLEAGGKHMCAERNLKKAINNLVGQSCRYE